MSNLKLPNVYDYATAAKFIGDADWVKIGYETYLARSGKDFVVLHHGSAILRYVSNGTIIGNNHGWTSSTTRNRLHRLTPFGFFVSQKNHKQRISTFTEDKEFLREFHILNNGNIVTDVE